MATPGNGDRDASIPAPAEISAGHIFELLEKSRPALDPGTTPLGRRANEMSPPGAIDVR
jgi:hypothetical protein